jgi:RNA polymerase sigma-70 factor, ECF subfamily
MSQEPSKIRTPDHTDADRLLVARIRSGDPSAWQQCIERFEGRLTAFAMARLRDATLAEDIVQDTFLGFLTSLPNFDERATAVETFLFTIAAHKIIDILRQRGRRPALRSIRPRDSDGDADGSSVTEPAARLRRVSSMAASREQRERDELAVTSILAELISQWRDKGDLERLKCIELLFVAGWPNQRAARELAITEQDVANHKHYIVTRIRQKLEKLGLSDERLRDVREG